jgi:hypothetical protein
MSEQINMNENGPHKKEFISVRKEINFKATANNKLCKV